MSTDKLKIKVHEYVDAADENILKVVQTILEQHIQLKSGDASGLDDEEIEELDKRWDSYKNGTNKGHSLADVKKEVGKKLKTIKHR